MRRLDGGGVALQKARLPVEPIRQTVRSGLAGSGVTSAAAVCLTALASSLPKGEQDCRRTVHSCQSKFEQTRRKVSDA